MKRGQVTFFVLTGIALLFIVGSLLYLRVQKQKTTLAPTIALPLHAQQVYSYVQSCLDDILPLGAFLLGKQSGFYRAPQDALRTNETIIAYYYKNSIKRVPTARDFENQFSLFIKDNLPLCVDFSRFPSLAITPGKVTSSITVRENNVDVQVTYPLKIEKESTVLALSKPYSSTLPLRITKILDAASKITQAAHEDPETIDLTLLLETDFDINLISYDNHTIIYAITDKQSMLRGVPYTFLFAHDL